MTTIQHPTTATGATAIGAMATGATTGRGGAGSAGRIAGTRALLAAAAVSGPLFALVSLTQVATRPGFDLTRHPLSLLSNGSLGWIQITTFLLTGALTVLGAVGLRRALRGTPVVSGRRDWSARAGSA